MTIAIFMENFIDMIRITIGYKYYWNKIIKHAQHFAVFSTYYNNQMAMGQLQSWNLASILKWSRGGSLFIFPLR